MEQCCELIHSIYLSMLTLDPPAKSLLIHISKLKIKYLLSQLRLLSPTFNMLPAVSNICDVFEI